MTENRKYHELSQPGVIGPADNKQRNQRKITPMTRFGFDKQHERMRQPEDKLTGAYQNWSKKRTPEQLSALLEAAAPVLNQAITSYAGGDTAYKPTAKRLAIEAFKTFDPGRGAKLRTHLITRLQPLQREYTKRTAPVRIPERVQLDRIRLEKAERSLEDQLGREPDDEEIMMATGLTPSRVAHVRKFRSGLIAETRVRSEAGEQYLPGVGGQSIEDIWVDYVYHDLDPTDKKIMQWKLGYRGSPVLSNNEISIKLSISASAVSQRANKIAARLEQLQDVAEAG